MNLKLVGIFGSVVLLCGLASQSLVNSAFALNHIGIDGSPKNEAKEAFRKSQRELESAMKKAKDEAKAAFEKAKAEARAAIEKAKAESKTAREKLTVGISEVKKINVTDIVINKTKLAKQAVENTKLKAELEKIKREAKVKEGIEKVKAEAKESRKKATAEARKLIEKVKEEAKALSEKIKEKKKGSSIQEKTN